MALTSKGIFARQQTNLPPVKSCLSCYHSFYEEEEPVYDGDDLGDDQYDDAGDAAANGIVHSSAGGDPSTSMAGQANQDRITTPYMTKYERARILGTRALQIS